MAQARHSAPTRYTSGTTPMARRFAGQIEDATIGLYFYNARYYDPALGRFVSADTIVPSPGDPQSLNRYSYVLNSPLNYRDPSGHAVDPGSAWDGANRDREDPPPPQVISREILWGHADLDLVEFPVGTSGVQETEEWQHTAGGVAHGTGLVIEICEAVGIAWDFPIPGEEDVLAAIDIGAETAGSIFHGETYLRGRPHPSLPEMTVIGQDALVSGGDFGIALTAKIVGGSLAGVPGLGVGEVVDMFTTGSSIYYDTRRIAGEISTAGAIGFYSDEEGRVHVVLLNYSTSEEAGTSHH
jgi:RHS repeat-associated protein